MVLSRPGVPSWMSAAASRVDFDGNVSSMSEAIFPESRETSSSSTQHSNNLSDFNLGFGERTFSAAGAAILSVILVNPLDVAKTRLQAQAAGVPYANPADSVCARMASLGPTTMFSDLRCSPSCMRAGILGAEAVCPPDCFQYKGTLDVFNKIIQQEGVARLWRGTNAGLALAVPTVGIYLPCYDIFRNWMEELTTRNAPYLSPYVPLVAGSIARSLACISCYPIELAKTRMQAFKEIQVGVKPPGVFKTLLGVLPSSMSSSSNLQKLQSCRILWTGVGAQLARDVPFSAICWSTLEPIRRRLLGLVGEESNVAGVLGANFAAGFVAGSLAAAATCPLDVVKTRRQIEKDPTRALSMTTRQTLMEVWRDGRIKGLFTGVGPRVARAGPSVGIVVSFYEVVKYVAGVSTYSLKEFQELFCMMDKSVIWRRQRMLFGP
ncbi:Mitochondrial substrate/solute carrier [Macleaya cordata]|uniref:Mitochondrial substrate/solute carrier n=1 Tax=Macleaya cordata TaxID=56857 RepID=A0A200PUL7_MACCD|nr:Mitochondrial substrate/solute carrier [Macleaya cordata]